MKQHILFLSIFFLFIQMGHAQVHIENSDPVSPYVDLDGDYYRWDDLKNHPKALSSFKNLEDFKFLNEIENIIKKDISVWFNPSSDAGMTAAVIPKDGDLSKKLGSAENKGAELSLVITPKADYCVLKHEQIHVDEQNTRGHFSSKTNPPFSLPSEEEFDERAALINYLNESAAHDEHYKCLQETNQSTDNLKFKFDYLYRNRLKKALDKSHPELRDYICKNINRIYKSVNFSVCD